MTKYLSDYKLWKYNKKAKFDAETYVPAIRKYTKHTRIDPGDLMSLIKEVREYRREKIKAGKDVK